VGKTFSRLEVGKELEVIWSEETILQFNRVDMM
jgi:hypothetical protein